MEFHPQKFLEICAILLLVRPLPGIDGEILCSSGQPLQKVFGLDQITKDSLA